MSSTEGWKKKPSSTPSPPIPKTNTKSKTRKSTNVNPLNLVISSSQESSNSSWSFSLTPPPSSLSPPNNKKRKSRNIRDDESEQHDHPSNNKKNPKKSTQIGKKASNNSKKQPSHIIDLETSSSSSEDEVITLKSVNQRKKKKVENTTSNADESSSTVKKHSKIVDDEEEDFDLDDETIEKILNDHKQESKTEHISSDDESSGDPSQKEVTEDWCEKYTPTDPSELIINKRVVSQFENWLCKYPSSDPKIQFENKPCIVTGSGGCGKRSLIYLMIQKHFGFKRLQVYHPQKIMKKLLGEKKQQNDNESSTWLTNKDETDLLDIYLQSKKDIQLNTRYHDHGGQEGLSKGPNPNTVIAHFRDFMRSCVIKRALSFTKPTFDSDISYLTKYMDHSTYTPDSTLHEYSVEIVVIEELPPVYTKHQKEKLFEALNYLLSLLGDIDVRKRKRLIKVIIISEYSSSSSAEYDIMVNLPRDFLDHCEVVKIPKVTENKILTRIKEICKQERVSRFIDQSEFEEIAECANGDLRQAIHQVQFFARGGKKMKDLFGIKKKTKEKEEITKILKRVEKKTEKKKKLICKTKDSYRDNATTIHHAAARILYGKRLSNGQVEFHLERDVLDLYKTEKNTSAQTITNYVQANAPYFCDDIQAVADSLDSFSECDSLYGKRFEASYDDNQLTTNFSQYQFLISSKSVLYNYQGMVKKFDSKKSILAPKVVKAFYKTREEKLKQLLLYLQCEDKNFSMLEKANFSTLPFDQVATLSNLFEMSDIFECQIPYLLEILKKSNQLVPFAVKNTVLRNIHNYPLQGMSGSKTLFVSSDEYETLDIVVNTSSPGMNHQTLSQQQSNNASPNLPSLFGTDSGNSIFSTSSSSSLFESILPTLFNHLSLGKNVRDENATFALPPGEDIDMDSEFEIDDDILDSEI
nr:unnamed protein product [Naegleria fowleri]